MDGDPPQDQADVPPVSSLQKYLSEPAVQLSTSSHPASKNNNISVSIAPANNKETPTNVGNTAERESKSGIQITTTPTTAPTTPAATKTTHGYIDQTHILLPVQIQGQSVLLRVPQSAISLPNLLQGPGVLPSPQPLVLAPSTIGTPGSTAHRNIAPRLFPPEAPKQLMMTSGNNKSGQKNKNSKRFECGFCVIVCWNQSDFDGHILKHLEYRPYECVLCGTIYTQEAEMEKHILENHTSKSYKCTNCELVLPSEKANLAHFEDHMKGLKYYCEVCSLVVEETGIDPHINTHLSKEPYACLFCDERGSNKKQMTEHMKAHNKNDMAPCKFCKKSCEQTEIATHIDVHRWDFTFCCSACDENFKSMDDIKQHTMKKHVRPVLANTCSWCSKTFTSKQQFLDHGREKHCRVLTDCLICHYQTGEQITSTHANTHLFRLNRCNVCGRCVEVEKNLYEHLITHPVNLKDDEVSRCINCGDHFNERQKLTVHSCPETKAKKLATMCQVCADIFTSKQEFHDHRASHTSVQYYQCRFCNEHLDDSEDLLSHVQRHTSAINGLRCFICQVCVKSDLRIHIMEHFLQLAEYCPVCEIPLIAGADVRMHIIQHLVKRYYACIFCLEEFSSPALLDRHASIHSLERPYSCNSCVFKCEDLKRLQKHVSNHVAERFATKGKTIDKEGSQSDMEPRGIFTDSPIAKFAFPSHMKTGLIKKGEKKGSSFVPAKNLVVKIARLDPTSIEPNSTATPTTTKATPTESSSVLKSSGARRAFPTSLEDDDDEDVIPPLKKPKYPSDRLIILDDEPSRKTSSPKSYKCVKCPKVLPESDFLQHLKSHQGRASLQCTQCNEKFSNKVNALNHMLCEHISNTSNRCKVCLKALSDDLVEEHMESHLSKDYYRCKPCREIFSDSELDDHSQYHIDGLVYQCLFCEMELKGPQLHKRKLMQHMSTHSEKEVTCHACKEVVKNNAIKSHISGHDGPIIHPMQCAICKKEFSVSTHLRDHIKDEHYIKVKNIYCGICKERFPTEAKLSLHILLAHVDKEQSCTICQDILPTPAHAEVHMRGHWHQFLSCHICNKRFDRDKIKSFDRHLIFCYSDSSHKKSTESAMESDDNNIKCSICDLAVGSSELLVKHLSKHTGEDISTTIKCPFCTSPFLTLQDCLSHCESHIEPTEEDPGGSMSPVEVSTEHVDQASDEVSETPLNTESASKDDNSSTSEVIPYIADNLDDDSFSDEPSVTEDLESVENAVKAESGEPKDLEAVDSGAKSESGKSKNTGKKKASGSTRMTKVLVDDIPGPITVFTCMMCEHDFQSEADLKKHILVHLSEDKTRCQVCGLFLKGCDLKTHVISHLESTYFTCIFCLQLSESIAELDKHYSTHVISLPTRCKICSLLLDSIPALQKHFKFHVRKDDNKLKEIASTKPPDENQALVTGPVAPVIPTASTAGLQGAFPLANNPTAPTAVISGAALPLVTNVNAPLVSASGTSLLLRPPVGAPIVVPVPNATAMTTSSLQGNIVNMPQVLQFQNLLNLPPGPLPVVPPPPPEPKELVFLTGEAAKARHDCPMCIERFFTVKGLRLHMKRHTPKSVSCPICHHFFRSPDLLELHLKQHKSQKFYYCTICAHRYITKSYLFIHMKSHHSEIRKIFDCEYCCKAFINQRELKRHMCRAVVGPYSCKICTRKFTNVKNMQEHLTSHSRAKRLVCLVCDGKFRDQRDYQRHRKACKGVERSKGAKGSRQCGICSDFVEGDIIDHFKRHAELGEGLLGEGPTLDASTGLMLEEDKKAPTDRSVCPVTTEPESMDVDREVSQNKKTASAPVGIQSGDSKVPSVSQPPRVIEKRTIKKLPNSDSPMIQIEIVETVETVQADNTKGQEENIEMPPPPLNEDNLTEKTSIHEKESGSTCSEGSASLNKETCPKPENGVSEKPSVNLDGLREHSYHSFAAENVIIAHGCSLCPMVFPNETDLQQHVGSHNPDSRLNSAFKPQERIPPIQPNMDGNYECQDCDKVFNTRRKIRRHMRYHQPDKKYSCKCCPKSFDSLRDCINHERTHTEERPFKCNTCGKRFKTTNSLNLHKEIHNNGPGHLCPVCGKEYRTLRLMRCHQASVHTDKAKKPRERSICHYCPKTFLSRHCMESHIKYKHMDGPVHVCEVCGRAYKDPKLLKLHSLVHRERKFKCDICGSKLRTKHQLTRHIKYHLEEKKEVCDICGMRFLEQGPLNRHKMTHTGERPFQCSQCFKCFKSKDQAKTHEATHSTLRPFTCGVCGAGHKTKKSLNNHLRRHAAEKIKVPCPLCDKQLGSRGSLKTHIREVHEGKKEKCHICSQTFRRILQLEEHMMKVHPEVDFPIRARRISMLPTDRPITIVDTNKTVSGTSLTHVQILPAKRPAIHQTVSMGEETNVVYDIGQDISHNLTGETLVMADNEEEESVQYEMIQSAELEEEVALAADSVVHYAMVPDDEEQVVGEDSLAVVGTPGVAEEQLVVMESDVNVPVFECGICKLLLSGDIHEHLQMHQDSGLVQGELVIQTE